MSPTYSTLIPCFNAERWINRAVESTLEQTAQDGETIVVDDGSTDGSQHALAPLAGKFQHVRRGNRGGNPTRNELLSLATGVWIQFLDADDYLLPTKVENQLAEAGDLTQADVLYSPILTDSGAGPVPPVPHHQPDPSEDLPTQWLRWQVCQTGGLLWRADAIRSIAGWNEAMPRCQDNELCLRAIKAGLRFKFCPTPGAVYRIWSEDTVSRKDPRALIETKTTLIDDMLAWLQKSAQLAPPHTQAAGQACFEMARTLAQHDLDAAAAYYRQRSAAGLIVPTGAAAPKHYRIAHSLLGFTTAERMARFVRR